MLTWGSNKFFQLGRKSKDSVQQALSDYNPGVVKALNDIEIWHLIRMVSHDCFMRKRFCLFVGRDK